MRLWATSIEKWKLSLEKNQYRPTEGEVLWSSAKHDNSGQM